MNKKPEAGMLIDIRFHERISPVLVLKSWNETPRRSDVAVQNYYVDCIDSAGTKQLIYFYQKRSRETPGDPYYELVWNLTWREHEL